MNGMMAVVCPKPGELILEERPLPERRPGEVLVAIRRIGVCGTDFHIFEGLHPFLQYPRVMGHELSAEVLEADAGSAFKPGQPVLVIPYLVCGTCVACRRGKSNCCTSLQCLGVHCDGGLAERISLPERNLYPADGLTLEQAAMVEFLAIGAHAVRRSRLTAEDKVLVVGAGPIGIGTALFAKLRGARVTLMDRVPDIVALAGRLTGISSTLVANDTAAGAVRVLTGGEGFNVVFDATGNARAMEKSFDYCCSGGVYVLVGVVKDRLAFSDPEFHRREMTLCASRNATREDFDTVVTAMRAGEIPSGLNTHSCGLDELPEAMPRWLHDRVGVVKAMVRVGPLTPAAAAPT
jgi:2-desacetyl-2-hydroxyethyl bacteriochlorophyllide A dehydrogenase